MGHVDIKARIVLQHEVFNHHEGPIRMLQVHHSHHISW